LTVQNTSDDTVHVAFAQYQSDADEWSTRAWWTVDPQHARLFEVTYASGDPYSGWFYYHLRGKPIHGGLWIQTHKKVVGGGQEFWVPKSLDSDTFVSHSLQKPASFTERLAKVRFDAIEVAPGVGEEAYYNIYYNG
jgi:hypothetical protein